MLDRRTLKLLDVLNNECDGSGYKVFFISDLLLSLPEQYKTDVTGIRDCIDALAAREYISVKYEDENEICLTTLSKGRFAFENRIDEEIEKHDSAVKYYLYSALGAFTGGAAAALVFATLFLLFGGRA